MKETVINFIKDFAMLYGIKIIGAIAIVIIGFCLAKAITKIIKKILTNKKFDPTLSKFICRIAKILVEIIVVLAALNILNFQTTSLVAIIGAAGLAVGFALQGSLSNFASGIMLIIFKPIKVHDLITAAGETGVVEEILTKRGGKCADISSVFVALARAAGVPAREVFGLRLGKKSEQDMTGGYHCWAEFYLPGTGWIPVDPADVRKIMLIKKLKLKDAQSYKEYYFGAVDEYRIVLERGGRGITLQPPQKGGPLNYFMYPYAEVDGRPLDYLDPKSFNYSVRFQRTMK